MNTARSHSYWGCLVAWAAVLGCATCPSCLAEGSTGPNVAHGSAQISHQGPNMTVQTGSNKTIIHWQTFNVPAGSTTSFLQPRPGSAVLNKVTGPMASDIYGTLYSNGRVYLVNPRGIVVGPSGVINTRGFVGTTLRVSDEDFKNGTLHLSGDSDALVVNLGTIDVDRGDVFLVASKVENLGTIKAPAGKAVLAAAREVLLTKDNQIFIQASTDDAGGTGVLNTGSIQALRAELLAQGNLYALAINNSGTVNATGVVHQNGKVLLRAEGGTIQNTGTLAAKTNVKNDKTVGGEIEVVADQIRLEGQAHLDASGDLGGGQINVGGSFQGKGPLPNATRTFVDSNVKIEADALQLGDGGSVIIWADQYTDFRGDISVQAKGAIGDGGFVEVSGQDWLGFYGTVNVTAAQGDSGVLLLDPGKVTLAGSDTNLMGNGSLNAPFANADSNADTIIDIDNTLLPVLNTDSASIFVESSGDLDVASPISWTSNSTLNLSAGGALSINAQVNGHTLILNSVQQMNLNELIVATKAILNAGAGVTAQGAGGVQSQELLLIGSGDFHLDRPNATDIRVLSAKINDGDLSVDNMGNLTVGKVEGISGVTVQGGNVEITASGGTIQIDQFITSNNKGGPGQAVLSGDVRPADGGGLIKGSGSVRLTGQAIVGQPPITVEITRSGRDLDSPAATTEPSERAQLEKLISEGLDETHATLKQILNEDADDRYLRLASHQIAEILRDVDAFYEAIDRGSALYHGMDETDQRREPCKELIVRGRQASMKVRSSSKLLQMLLKRIYLNKQLDRNNHDAFKGAVENLIRAKEGLIVASQILQSGLESFAATRNESAQERLTAFTRATKLTEERVRKELENTPNSERVYTDVLTFAGNQFDADFSSTLQKGVVDP